ncbi:MAG: class I SAM-dependent methyltransferase [Anaerolineae bacterium]|nr:class I SAM-dependent methyltransferase [Anaerolineae bacterium]
MLNLETIHQERPIVNEWSSVLERLSIDSNWQQAVSYLSSVEQSQGITLQRLWQLLDQAWDELRLKNTYPVGSEAFLHHYYQHPIWLINATFCESYEATINDRLAAVRLVTHVNPRKILDFGGGIGTVSRLCSHFIPQAEVIDLVDITEFRHTIKHYLADYHNIRVLAASEGPYDAIISTEVLEHLTNPVETIIKINRLLRTGGAFSGSWSFMPVIKSHLPQNFHLHRTMPWIIRCLGFGFYGFERRGSMVFGFVKHSNVSPIMIKKARLLEKVARLPIPIEKILLLLKGL